MHMKHYISLSLIPLQEFPCAIKRGASHQGCSCQCELPAPLKAFLGLTHRTAKKELESGALGIETMDKLLPA